MSEDKDRVNRRHLLGFRRFQYVSLRALTKALDAINGRDGGPEPGKPKDGAAVKVGDMKALVSVYKEAVTGERVVLGMGGARQEDWPEEMLVRWVEDEDEPLTEEGPLDAQGT